MPPALSPELDSLYQQGLACSAAGQLDQALGYFDRLVATCPQDAQLRAERAQLRVAARQIRQAIHDFSLCLKAEPDNPWHRYRRAKAYMQLELPAQAVKDFTRVIDLVEIGRKLTPAGDQMAIYFERGRAHLGLGNAQTARYDFQSYPLPETAEAQTCFAEVYLLLEDVPMALNQLNHALRLDPAYRPALLKKAEILITLEDAEARDCCDTLLALDAEDAEALCLRGTSWGLSGDYDACRADCRLALELDPAWVPAWRQLGLSWLSQGEYEQARAAFVTGLELGDDDPESRFNLGLARLRLQDYLDAVEDFSYVLRYQPENARALYYRNFAHAGLENYPAAFKDLQYALAIDPSLGENRDEA